MTTERLKEYLGIVIDMEKNIHVQYQTIQEIQKEIDDLGWETEIPKPNMEKLCEKGTVDFILSAFCVFVSIFFGVGIVFSSSQQETQVMFTIALLLIISALLELVLGLGKSIKRNKQIEEYEVEMAEYEQAVKDDRIRVENELALKQYLEIERDRLNECQDYSVNVLDRIYCEDVIFPKYRNFVTVCSLYEYIDSGRCDCLEGADGAYNMFEREIRMDRIVLKLDIIISRLDRIADNQYVLYNAIEESNRLTDMLVNSTSRVADYLYDINGNIQKQGELLDRQLRRLYENSELGVYYTEQTQKELHYMNRMDYLLGRNDGVFYNAPPS